jgi:predicted nuclease with TOPRIM domain
VTNDLSELEVEMRENKEKQNELLAFTAKLTEKNTLLQSENTSLTERLQSIESELNAQIDSLKQLNQTSKQEVYIYFARSQIELGNF